MNDKYGRRINYLRLSLTERCALKCSYCSASHGEGCVKEREMTADDALFIAEACSKLGFDKIRLTGGEPLLRRDILKIVSGISASGAYKDIAITTNGQLLAPMAADLKNAGLMRCNVSIDSFVPEKYKKITGGELQPVLDGIKAALECFGKVKINTVLIKGVNDDEAESFFEAARRYPVDVRFIELMPMGDGGEGIPNGKLISLHPELVPAGGSCDHSPARYYTADGYRGRIGFISPMSGPFCADCNRLRITSDLKIRPCLGNNCETDVSLPVKNRDEQDFKNMIENAVASKPEKGGFDCGFSSERKMNAIGG